MNHPVEEFECPNDPTRKILLNLQEEQAYIMHEPSEAELRAAAEAFEQEVTEAFWTKAMLATSQYQESLPYGLACNSAKRNAIEWHAIYHKLTGETARNVQTASKFCRGQNIETLKTAIGELQPRTVQEAKKLLAAGGLAVFTTPSMIEWTHETPKFSDFVSKLCKVARSPGEWKRSAVNFLIKMRGIGWLLLPTNIVQHIGAIIRGLHSKNVGWETPLPRVAWSRCHLQLSL